MDNKTVLVLAEYGWRNGGENSFLAIANLLAEKNWRFVVACPQDTELWSYLREIQIESVNWNVFDAAGDRKSQQQIRCEIGELISNIKPAIVHCNSLSTGRLAGPVTSQLNVPSVGYLRDIIKLSRTAVGDINQLSAVVAVSNATMNFHILHGLDPAKVQVIYNGVDLTQFTPRPATGGLHEELGISARDRIVCCIGQIGLRKGTDTVIESFIKLSREIEGLVLLIVGIRNSAKQEAIDFEKHCHQLANESIVNNRIYWLGRRSDASHLLNESCLLLHGARQEPLGRVLLESAAAGCPFVATEVGGTCEIVSGISINELICKVDSPLEMTAKANLLLTNTRLYEKACSELRQIAESRFNARRCSTALHQVYDRLLSNSAFSS